MSGKRPGAVFDVYVLDTPKILVQALPGGVVVISRGAVELTGRDDSALAFLLAHEVAHVIRDHHGLLRSYQEIGVTGPSPPAAPKDEDARALQAMELEADRLGLLYTSLAGYRGRAAVPIVQRVIALTGSSPFHPEPRKRAAIIEGSIRHITAHLELFSVGLVYMATGRFEEAARIYETFATLYPSREVYNNLGVAYHEWALLYKRDDGWLRSITVDARTRAQTTLKDITDQPPETGKDAHPLFRKYLDRALAAYRLAVESDPDYAVGHNNLGVAYLDAGETDFAIGEFKRAIRADATLKEAWNNRGIAYVKSGDTGQAQSDFLRAISLDPSYPDPHGNLAKLFETERKPDLAAPERQIFAKLKPPAPSGSQPAHQESLEGLVVGMDLARALKGRAGLITFSVPLGPREDDALKVFVDEPAGLVIGSRRGTIHVLGATEGFLRSTSSGVTIGTVDHTVRSVYGGPVRAERAHLAELWVYPQRALVFLVVNGRVASWWLTPREDATAK